MNGTMPATVNSRDGSGDTSEALGTTVCPRWAKCSRKRRRISAVCIGLYSVGRARPGERVAVERSGVGGVRPPARGQLDLVPGGQRRVEAGAVAQLGLPLGGRGA